MLQKLRTLELRKYHAFPIVHPSVGALPEPGLALRALRLTSTGAAGWRPRVILITVMASISAPPLATKRSVLSRMATYVQARLWQVGILSELKQRPVAAH